MEVGGGGGVFSPNGTRPSISGCHWLEKRDLFVGWDSDVLIGSDLGNQRIDRIRT
jgi:hypothetical protein